MNKPTNTIVLASGNAGKLREFNRLFTDFGIHVAPQSEFNVEDAEETGLSFVENAIIKARNASKATGLPAVSDDSGIEVDALNGAPGIYSARYAGNDDANNKKLLSALEGKKGKERTARYQCVLAYMRHADDPTPVIAQGAWEGEILESPIGENGFGYDPIFWVPTHNCSSAELDKDEKNRISHRSIALTLLVKQLRELKLI